MKPRWRGECAAALRWKEQSRQQPDDAGMKREKVLDSLCTVRSFDLLNTRLAEDSGWQGTSSYRLRVVKSGEEEKCVVFCYFLCESRIIPTIVD